MNKIFRWLICLSLFWLFSLGGCLTPYETDFTREPKVVLRILNPNFSNYQRVFGVGGKGNIAFVNSNIENILPLDLTRDTTVYVFEKTAQSKDTLTLAYTRIVNPYGQRGCSNNAGFSMQINELRMVPQLSTFPENEITFSLEIQP
jgi:hypothetical protein